MTILHEVHAYRCERYDEAALFASLPDDLFALVRGGDRVVLKPNWVMESHKSRQEEWEQVITHPAVITAVLRKVLERLRGSGRVTIMDGPMTEASFERLMARCPVELWRQLAARENVLLEIVDLRDHEWVTRNGITVERRELPGDPRGKVVVDLQDDLSEFWGHQKSPRGYYGADYDLSETNRAHDGHHNLYSVSRTAVEADVFINLPKLKTHRKAGITCCLKNLVGINTYKNYLPHHSEGGPLERGDQFPADNVNARLEGPLVAFLKQHLFKNPALANLLSPLNTVAKKVFGDSALVVRNGSWYGNDTIWRTIVDLNKVLLFANSDGTLRPYAPGNAKRYIGVVDAILAGDGDGPLSPDPVPMGRLICGGNPVAIDAACALLLGFDPKRIPSIWKAFSVRRYPLCTFLPEEVELFMDGKSWGVIGFPPEAMTPVKPQHGWQGHIEVQ